MHRMQPEEQKSDYKIPADEIAIAKIKDGKQSVEINLKSDRFSPAVVVMQVDWKQYGQLTAWN